MAIKVIHRGTPPEDVVWAGTCKTCRSQLECSASDGTHQWDQREGGEWVDIRCPVCRHVVQCYPLKPDNSAAIRGGLGT